MTITSLFSVIIPCYNQAHFLSKALDSLIGQAFTSWEALIVNDGSTDNTKALAETYVMRDQRIKLINQANAGLSNSRNTGIHASRGEFLVFLDADDWLYPEFLSVVLKSFDKSASVVITGYEHWKDNLVLHRVSRPISKLWIADFSYANFAPPVAFTIRKSLLDTIGLFDEKLRSAEDWDLWIRAAKAQMGIVNIPNVLAAYRYSDKSMSRDGSRMYSYLKEVFLRVPERDFRINISTQITGDKIEVPKGILGLLIPCLGVMVIQGKVKEAISLYHREKETFKFHPRDEDFQKLNSYLTFRYWNSRNELEKVLNELEPLIFKFLKGINEHNFSAKKISRQILSSPQKKYFKLSYGKVIGKILYLINYYVKN